MSLSRSLGVTALSGQTQWDLFRILQITDHNPVMYQMCCTVNPTISNWLSEGSWNNHFFFLITTHDLCEVSSLVDALRLKHTQAVSLSSVLWRQENAHDCYTSVCSKHTYTQNSTEKIKSREDHLGNARLCWGWRTIDQTKAYYTHVRTLHQVLYSIRTRKKRKGLKFLQLLYIQDICEIVCALAWWSFTWHACLQAAAPYCYIWNFWFTQMCYTHTHTFFTLCIEPGFFLYISVSSHTFHSLNSVWL